MNCGHIVERKNIERYQRLIECAADENQRLRLLRLLTDELWETTQVERRRLTRNQILLDN